MLRVFTAPHRYVQGPGALNNLAQVLDLQNERVFVLLDDRVADQVGPPLRSSLEAANIQFRVVVSSGEVTDARIRQLADAATALAPDLVIAAGGGKTLDVGKGIARLIETRIVTVPTIASNDGPTSRVIALYDDEHRLIATPQMVVNPYAVVVDTSLIAAAPPIFLLSGIGDGVAKRFEAAACRRGDGVTSNGTRPLELPGAIAERCYDVLLEHSVGALTDLSLGNTTPAVERVIEAVVLMSGLAFENGGLSLAHSLTRGLMRIPGAADQLHGFHVAYALLVQLTHERAQTHYEEVRSFLRSVGLPVSLTELGADASATTMSDIAAATLTAPHMANCVPPPSTSSLIEAMKRVETEAAP